MLPFLKPQKSPGVIVAQTKPGGGNDIQHEEGDESAPLKACAVEIIQAINSNDPDKLAQALQSAYDICDSSPEEMVESEE